MIKALTLALCLAAPFLAGKYKIGSDSMVQEGVSKGKVTRHEWRSEVFKGTLRQYYVYVPAQYDGAKEANVLVFQDGHAYIGPKGQIRASTVMDNLIAKGEIPLTVAFF